MNLCRLGLATVWAFCASMVLAASGSSAPVAPGNFSGCKVLKYAEEGASSAMGTRQRLKVATSASAVSSTDAVKTQTWVVQSSSETNVTYAVRQTLLASGEIELCSYTPNRVLATLDAGQNETQFRAALAAKGLTVKYELMKDSDGNSVFVVEAEDTASDVAETMTASIQSTGFCNGKIYKDTVFSVCATTPNDPYWSDQWNMEKIGAPAAWDATHEASDVVVAVLDTGINYNHMDLNENLWTNSGEFDKGSNGVDDDGNGIVDDFYGVRCVGGNLSGNPMDDVSHGSHCAGIIGAVGNNGVGVAGVAWSAKLMALKFCDADGNGSSVDAIRCLGYAEAHNVKVVNCSWIVKGDWNIPLAEKIAVMGRKGTIFVCAAGNASTGEEAVDLDMEGPPTYPACYTHSNVITVAATDSDDELANFSYYGALSVDIAAPGVDVYSTVLGSTAIDYKSGTSMAAPHVTGALALLMAYYPDESPYTLVQKLYECGEPLDSLKGKVRTGKRLSLKGLFGLRAPSGAEATATLGTMADSVVLYWNAVTGAGYYRVWRASSADGEKTMLRDWHVGLTYTDTTAEPGVHYFYFLQAAASSAGASASPYSTAIEGWRGESTTSVMVTFDAAGGTVATASAPYEIGGTYGNLPVPTYAGQVFLGWHTAATGGTQVNSNCVVRADVTTLHAHWIADGEPRLENLFARQRYPWNGYVDVSFGLAGVAVNYAADVSLTAKPENGGAAIPLATWVGKGPTNLVNGSHALVWDSGVDAPGGLFTNLTLAATLAVKSLKPSAPTNVSATDGTYSDKVIVTWDAAAGATSYEVYRYISNCNVSALDSLATKMGTVTTASYTDTTAVPGDGYFYWVKAVNAAGTSPYSASDRGYRKKVLVSIAISGAGSITAGNTSTYTCSATYNDDKSSTVTPTWSISSGSTYASVDASGVVTAKSVSSAGSAVLQASYSEGGIAKTATKTISIATRSVTITFNGNGGTPSVASQSYTAYGSYNSLPTASWAGRTFAGWYTAASGGTQVTASSTVPAAATTLYAHWTVNTPTAPTNVSATDGTSTSGTTISWSSVSGATKYYVYRYTSNNSSSATSIGSTTSTSYTDTTGTAGTTYYYWVKAYNAGGYSPFSSYNTGYKKILTVPPAPVLSCTNGTAGPSLSWSSVDGATSYKVYMYQEITRNYNTQYYYTLLGTTSSTSYTVTTIGGVAIGTTTYSFCVTAVNSAGESDYSNVRSGHKRY